MQLEFDLIVFILTKLIRSQVMEMSLNFADMLNNDTRGLFAGHAAHWGARKVFLAIILRQSKMRDGQRNTAGNYT